MLQQPAKLFERVGIERCGHGYAQSNLMRSGCARETWRSRRSQEVRAVAARAWRGRGQLVGELTDTEAGGVGGAALVEAIAAHQQEQGLRRRAARACASLHSQRNTSVISAGAGCISSLRITTATGHNLLDCQRHGSNCRADRA